MKLAIGTVQFGLNYGVTNLSGKASHFTCEKILKLALDAGISILDTAAAYGTSEGALGGLIQSSLFSIVTKVPSLKDQEPSKINVSLEQSLKKLNLNSVYGLLLHDENDLLGNFADKNYNQLQLLKNTGKVKKIGVSFYSVEAAIKILNDYDIDLIQIPASHLDRRFEHAGVIELAKKKGVEVHVRTLFLQGLLVVNEDKRPFAFKQKPELLAYDAEVKKSGLTSLQFALLYLIQTLNIDLGVVGCQSSDQLKEIIVAYQKCKKSNVVLADISTKNESLINPVNWN